MENSNGDKCKIALYYENKVKNVLTPKEGAENVLCKKYLIGDEKCDISVNCTLESGHVLNLNSYSTPYTDGKMMDLPKFIYKNMKFLKNFSKEKKFFFEIKEKNIRCFSDCIYLARLLEKEGNINFLRVGEDFFKKEDTDLWPFEFNILQRLILKKVRLVLIDYCPKYDDINCKNTEKSELGKGIDSDVTAYCNSSELSCLNDVVKKIKVVSLTDFYVGFITEVLKSFVSRGVVYKNVSEVFRKLYLDEIELDYESVKKIYTKIVVENGLGKYRIVNKISGGSFEWNWLAIRSTPVEEFYSLFFRYLVKDVKCSCTNNDVLEFIISKKGTIDKLWGRPIEITYDVSDKAIVKDGEKYKVFSDDFFARYGKSFYVLDSYGWAKDVYSNIFNNTIATSYDRNVAVLRIIPKKFDEIKDLSKMFMGRANLLKIDRLSSLVTINVTNMSSMFEGCSKLETFFDTCEWDTSNVTNMSRMFYGCKSLNNLFLMCSWDTSKVTDMSYMFYECGYKWIFLDISKWNTSNVKDMSYMFYECKLPILYDELYVVSEWVSNCKSEALEKITNIFRLEDMKYIVYIGREGVRKESNLDVKRFCSNEKKKSIMLMFLKISHSNDLKSLIKMLYSNLESSSKNK